MSGERGQATVEWVGVLLVVSLAFGALLAVAPLVDGRSLGGFLAHRISCAVRGQCRDGDSALARAYGARDAELVRAHAPNLVYEPGERQIPVDWRRCRKSGCASAPDDRDLDVHRSDEGVPATVFTRVLRKGGRRYLQYWFYYPDSNSTVLGSDKAWEALWLLPRLRGLVRNPPRYPGFHKDDCALSEGMSSGPCRPARPQRLKRNLGVGERRHRRRRPCEWARLVSGARPGPIWGGTTDAWIYRL